MRLETKIEKLLDVQQVRTDLEQNCFPSVVDYANVDRPIPVKSRKKCLRKFAKLSNKRGNKFTSHDSSTSTLMHVTSYKQTKGCVSSLFNAWSFLFPETYVAEIFPKKDMYECRVFKKKNDVLRYAGRFYFSTGLS